MQTKFQPMLLLTVNNSKENYQDQIKALELFFKDAFPQTVPTNIIKFGAGTALSIIFNIG